MMESLYDKLHRLFSYNPETGLLTRKVAVLGRWGKSNPKPNCKIGDVAGYVNSYGYLRVGIGGKDYKAHRIIWLMETGDLPKEHIDHVNGDRADNRLVNLREATNAENGCNRGKPSNNTSGFKGVYADSRSRKNPYVAYINLSGKRINLGRFQTPDLAHQAYCKASKEFHGEFARVA